MRHTTVVVLGASGFIGSYIVNSLVQAGKRVIVATRRRQHASHLTLLPVDVVEADVHQPAQLERLLAGADAVINLVGVLHGRRASPYGAEFARAHVGLPSCIVAACGVQRVRRVLHVTVFQPSLVFGPQDRFLNTFASLQRTFPVIPLACAGTRVQPIYVDDVALALTHALDLDATLGKVYELAGPAVYTLEELVRFTGEVIGRPTRIVRLSPALARLQAAVFERLPGEPLITRDNLDTLSIDNVARAGIAPELGIEPKSLESVAPLYLSGATREARDMGGAIRDALLGKPVQDRDYVVVGATPEQMMAQGFRPVGKDFPVFLHPRTQEEYALARTERKTSAGYHGFQFFYAPDVTLEQDLARRDLTINAMARAVSPDGALYGPLIDPFNGRADLAARVFRHVSEAFAEDPVRILRIARFAARFADFTIAPSTLALMRRMAAAGEADALVPERVWQEVSRGLMEHKPSRMFDVLRECDALQRVLPEVARLFGVPQRADYHPEVDTGVHVMMVIDYAAARHYALPVRFAALMHDLGKADTPPDVLPRHIGHEMRSVERIRPLCERLRVPNDCRDLALLVAREHGNVHRVMEMGAAVLVRMLERSDALRKPARFAQALQACEADLRGRLNFESHPYPQAERLRIALVAARGVDAGAIAQRTADEPARIKDAVHAARIAAVEQAIRDDAR
ncbi:hypothetical protein DFQ30_001398 [Apophysomyces sp. BC1015]|nr:hypothetical protein DFQ30_001398 [Apophysomyces sp. BC1015]